MLLANSLFKGFADSNFIGQGIVEVQIVASLFMVAVVVGKLMALRSAKAAMKAFLDEFATCQNVMEYYVTRRPSTKATGLVGIYAKTCERFLKLLTPDTRAVLAGQSPAKPLVFGPREMELVKGACEHALDEEEIRVERGMGMIATVVALAPMLGLLGTVWGVLDAFAEMGQAGSASLATIAPSISAALVTTVVGLLIAIPGVCCSNYIGAQIRSIVVEQEGFADELMGRIACEYQGRGV